MSYVASLVSPQSVVVSAVVSCGEGDGKEGVGRGSEREREGWRLGKERGGGDIYISMET